MPTYEDPIRALRIDLAPGWAYDPFTSTLKEFCFAPWNRAEEILVVNVEPARLSSNQPDEMWLAQLKDEITAKADFVDLPSISGRAIAAAIYHADGHVQRVALVRGARVDFALEHNGADPSASDHWAVLKAAVLSVLSAANTNPGEHSGAEKFRAAVSASETAAKQGDGRTAMLALRDAIWMLTADWLRALATFDDGLQINIALEIARVFTRMALLDTRPVPMLRKAELLVRRVAHSARKSSAQSASKIDDHTYARLNQTLEGITGELHRVIDPADGRPNSRMRALSHRASWLVGAATEAVGAKSQDHAGDLAYAAVLAEAARDDLLTLAVQRRRETQPALTSNGELTKDDQVWAALLIEALQVQYLCAMDRQDANRSGDAATLLVTLTNLLAQTSALNSSVLQVAQAAQATALMQQAGRFLFTGDDALKDAESTLENAEKLLDQAGDEGVARTQLCLNLGWVRFYSSKLDQALKLSMRGLAAAQNAPATLRASLHALRAQALLGLGRPQDGLADADAAIEGANPLLSTHLLIRASIKTATKDNDGALKDVAKSLQVACADNVLGQDVVQILFAASTMTEAIDVPASLDLTWAAQSVMDARRLALQSQDDRILFGDAAQQRQLAETLVMRLVDANEVGSALCAADLTRARSLNQLLGLPTQSGVAALPSQLKFALASTENVISDLRAAADTIRRIAEQALEAGGLQPALSSRQMIDLAASTGSAVLILQPAGERICLLLVLPDGDVRLIVAESPLHMADVSAALEQLQGALGIRSANRGDDDSPLVDVEDDDAVLQQAVQTLSDALIKPIASALKVARLIIVPYRELALIPFSLLTRANGKPLVEDFALSIIPSMATLSLIQKRRTAVPGLRSFIAGDPAADPKNGLIPLPGAAAEAEAVQGLLLASGIPKDLIKLLTHEQATEEQYRQSARGCRLVHLACHATLRQPAVQSALFLAPGPHDDGQLYPPEIAGIGLDNAVVFLSACQTGLGRPTADGVLGLSRAFLEAGARAVIMSLWKVADQSTSVLAGHFYRALLGIEGQPSTAARALQLAMLATRKDLADGKVITSKNELLDDDPAHWAPFLLLGDGGFLADG